MVKSPFTNGYRIPYKSPVGFQLFIAHVRASTAACRTARPLGTAMMRRNQLNCRKALHGTDLSGAGRKQSNAKLTEPKELPGTRRRRKKQQKFGGIEPLKMVAFTIRISWG